MLRLRNFIDKIIEWFLVTLMVMLVADVLLQVASRYLMDNAVSFTDELAGFLLIWVGLAGGAYMSGKREHLAITFLIEKAKFPVKRYLGIATDLLILVFALLTLIIGGSWLVYTRFYLGQVSASLEIPLGYVYLILPISGLLICFYSLHDIHIKLEDQQAH